MGLIATMKYFSQFKKEDVFRPGTFNPGMFDLDKTRLKKLRPGIYNPLHIMFGGQFDSPSGIGAIMNDGDIQTAVVVSVKPLLVSCYSEDMDAAVLLCYPEELGTAKGWEVGTRLIATMKYNAYGTVRRNKDIYPGPNADKSSKSCGPVIVDLYTDETEYLARKKSEIPEYMWEKAMDLGMRYMTEHPGIARNGLGDCFKDGRQIEKIRFNPKSIFD